MTSRCRTAIEKRDIPKALQPYCRDGSYPVASFDPQDAPYLVESSDPPFAAAQRALVRTILAYNKALAAYAEGRALAPYQAEFERAAGELSLLATVVTGSTLPLSGVVGVFSALVQPLASAASEEAFRKNLPANFGLIDQCLLALRDGRPVSTATLSPAAREALAAVDGQPQSVTVSGGSALMFEVLTDDLSRRIETTAAQYAKEGTDEAKRKAETEERLVAEREKIRVLVAEWVVTLDAVRAALHQAKLAAERPATALSTARSVSTGVMNLRLSAEATKRALAKLGV